MYTWDPFLFLTFFLSRGVLSFSFSVWIFQNYADFYIIKLHHLVKVLEIEGGSSYIYHSSFNIVTKILENISTKFHVCSYFLVTQDVFKKNPVQHQIVGVFQKPQSSGRYF